MPTITPRPVTPIALTLDKSVQNQTLVIGILASSQGAEGSDYRELADGARVAAYRFQMNGATIKFVTQLDDGTVSGATDKLQKLDNAGVAGIIIASAGQHIREAVARAHIESPIILPYETPYAPSPGVWSIGSTTSDITTALQQTLTHLGVSHPYLVTSLDSSTIGITSGFTDTYSDDPALASRIVDALNRGQVDSLVISAQATAQATLASAVQGLLDTRQAPIILTPQALTPTFATMLEATGIIPTTLVTVGVNVGDSAALTPTDNGEAAATFFTGLRIAAGDSQCYSVYGEVTCAEVAGTADIPTHDATIALIRAVEHAGTTQPEKVKEALGSLKVTHDDGLAGPQLDFTTSNALPTDATMTLYATTADPGVRPAGSPQPALYWGVME